MTRRCRIDDCTNEPRPGRRICFMHRNRIHRHGDPDFTQWTVADETDVQLLVAQRRSTEGLTRLERILLARGLTEQGLSAAEIACILGVTDRTVFRWRAREHHPAA